MVAPETEPAVRRLIGLLLVVLPIAVGAQTLPQDRVRTGMFEAGLRVWEVAPRSTSLDLLGVSVSRFLSDNVSAGILLAGVDSGKVEKAVLANALARLYFFPMQSWTPWMELRGGGLVAPAKNGGATHFGIGAGVRWRPVEWFCADLQLAGFERWGYPDPSEGTNGSAEWVLQGSPASVSGWRIVPTPSFQILF